MTTESPFTSRVFEPATDDTSAFDCGEPDLDRWLREHAAAAQRARVARTFVWVPDESSSRRVVAYYTLSAHAVTRREAPSRIGRGVVDPVPAALIGKLALDRTLYGTGLGVVLLADALERIVRASQSGPAVRAIVVDAATARGRALCARAGFVAVPSREDRMIIRTQTVAQALEAP